MSAQLIPPAAQRIVTVYVNVPGKAPITIIVPANNGVNIISSKLQFNDCEFIYNGFILDKLLSFEIQGVKSGSIITVVRRKPTYDPHKIELPQNQQQSDPTDLPSLLSAAREKIRSLKFKKSAAQAKIEKLMSENLKLNSQVTDLTIENISLKYSEAQQKIEELNEENEKLRDQVADLQIENVNLKYSEANAIIENIDERRLRDNE